MHKKNLNLNQYKIISPCPNKNHHILSQEPQISPKMCNSKSQQST